MSIISKNVLLSFAVLIYCSSACLVFAGKNQTGCEEVCEGDLRNRSSIIPEVQQCSNKYQGTCCGAITKDCPPSFCLMQCPDNFLIYYDRQEAFIFDAP